MNLVPTVAVIISAMTALLSTIPSTHALVAPPSASPQHRPLRRVTLPAPMQPAPRADRTALRYLDERTDAEPVFCNIISTTLSSTACDSPLANDERTNAEPVFRKIWMLREQARTIKQHDRKLYFDFVNNAASTAADSASPSHPLRHLARETSSAPTLAPSAITSETKSAVPRALFSLPSSVASLWTQARTVAEEDRRRYFDFVKNQSLDDNLAAEPGLSTGLVAKRENNIKIDMWW